MNFLEMLLMSRKLTFDEGKVSLYGKSILILPASPFFEYIATINSDTDMIQYLYATEKKALIAEYEESFSRSYNASDSATWICDNINLYGYGRIRYDDAKTAPYGKITLENSPFTIRLRGVTGKPVDHILRAIIAGTVSAITHKDTDVIETNCSVGEGNVCSMQVGERGELMSQFPELFKTQIG